MSAAALRLRNARFRRRGNKTANQTATTKRRPRCTFVQTGGAVIGLNGAWARRHRPSSSYPRIAPLQGRLN